jgi:hypothetical protein
MKIKEKIYKFVGKWLDRIYRMNPNPLDTDNWEQLVALPHRLLFLTGLGYQLITELCD